MVSLEIFWRLKLGSVDVLSVAIVLLIGVAGLLVVVKRASCVLCIVYCVLRASCALLVVVRPRIHTWVGWVGIWCSYLTTNPTRPMGWHSMHGAPKKLLGSVLLARRGWLYILSTYHIRDEQNPAIMAAEAKHCHYGRLLVMQISPPIRHQTPQVLILSCRALPN